MSSLRLQQLIYTSFDRIGYKLITGLKVPPAIQTAFMVRVVQQHWNAQNSLEKNFQLSYIYQVSPYSALFGWMYIDEVDGQKQPYFVCYYLENALNLASLAKVLTCLSRGPLNMLDRFFPLAFLEDFCLDFTGIDTYKPARAGIFISADYRNQCITFLQQGRFINLLSTTEQQVSFQSIVDTPPEPTLSPSNSPLSTSPLSTSKPIPSSEALSVRSQKSSQPIFNFKRFQRISLPTLKPYLRNSTFLTLGILAISGSSLALFLPKILSGQHQSTNVIPEILKSDSRAAKPSSQASVPAVRPYQTPNNPLLPKTSLDAAPLPDPTLLSPFVDLNLQNYHLQNRAPNSAHSSPSSPARNTSRPRLTPDSNTSAPAPSDQLFSNFRIQDAPPPTSFDPGTPSIAPPSYSPNPPASAQSDPEPAPVTDDFPTTPTPDNLATLSPAANPPATGGATLPSTTASPSSNPEPPSTDTMMDE
jgi:hypothetical protein